MSQTKPRVAVIPSDELIVSAVARGGGDVSEPGDADAIVWMDPSGPVARRAPLASSPVRWMQLPFAGIEEFWAAGVRDPARIWTCAKGTYGPSTAEHALALLLMASRLIHRHARQHSWMRRREF